MAMKKFSNTVRITKGNLDKVPGDKPGVYRIKNAQGNVLYVGKAKGGRLDDRIAEHKGRFQGGTQFQYKTVHRSEDADRLERREIKEHIPPRNKKK